jgi:hypothetical protein
MRTEKSEKLNKYSSLRATPILIELSDALRNELIGRRMPRPCETLSISDNLGNFRRCPPILAMLAILGNLGESWQLLQISANLGRDCQVWRTVPESLEIGSQLSQQIKSVEFEKVMCSSEIETFPSNDYLMEKRMKRL